MIVFCYALYCVLFERLNSANYKKLANHSPWLGLQEHRSQSDLPELNRIEDGIDGSDCLVFGMELKNLANP